MTIILCIVSFLAGWFLRPVWVALSFGFRLPAMFEPSGSRLSPRVDWADPSDRERAGRGGRR